MIKKMLLTGVLIVAVAMAGCSSGSAEKVNVYNWGDYIDPATNDSFKTEKGIDVVYDTYDRNEDMYQKLKNGGADYDVCVPSDYMIEKMVKEGMLAEIDYNNVPEAKQIMSRFKNLPFDPDNKYSVPYLWGTIGIIYNTKVVKEPVDSWDILWSPAYKGKILMMDSQRDAFMVAEKKLGISMNSTSTADLEKAKKELIAQKPLVLAYVSDNIKDMMINEEAAVAVCWSGEALFMMSHNKNLAYAVPKEGTNLWFDNLVIPKNAPNKKNAEAYINYLCKPDVALKNAQYMGYPTPNQGAFDMLKPDEKNNKVIYPEQSVLDKCEVYKDLGDEFVKALDRAWTEVKAN